MCAIPALSKVSIQRSTRLKSYCTAPPASCALASVRSEEHTSELQSQSNLVCRLLLEKKNTLLNSLFIPPATRCLPVAIIGLKYIERASLIVPMKLLSLSLCRHSVSAESRPTYRPCSR